jgi:hypothetical protein
MSDTETPQTPKPSGFGIKVIEDSWAVVAIGEYPWFVGGFESASDAQDWLLSYLTTNLDNNARLQSEISEMRRENERLAQQALAAAILYSETPESKRTIH